MLTYGFQRKCVWNDVYIAGPIDCDCVFQVLCFAVSLLLPFSCFLRPNSCFCKETNQRIVKEMSRYVFSVVNK